jgi:hypothetical protein
MSKVGSITQVTFARAGANRITPALIREQLIQLGMDDEPFPKGWSMGELVDGVYHNPDIMTTESGRAVLYFIVTAQVAERNYDEAIKVGGLDPAIVQEMLEEAGFPNVGAECTFNVLRRTPTKKGGGDYQPFMSKSTELTGYCASDFFRIAGVINKLRPQVRDNVVELNTPAHHDHVPYPPARQRCLPHRMWVTHR